MYLYQHLFDGEMAKLTFFAELFRIYGLSICKNECQRLYVVCDTGKDRQRKRDCQTMPDSHSAGNFGE